MESKKSDPTTKTLSVSLVVSLSLIGMDGLIAGKEIMKNHYIWLENGRESYSPPRSSSVVSGKPKKRRNKKQAGQMMNDRIYAARSVLGFGW
jgi:hypothetical protein